MDLLVPLGSNPYGPYTCGLSTRSSPWSLIMKPNLGDGFALICFQRLSVPNVATEQCPWQDNSYTRGSCIPVLSSHFSVITNGVDYIFTRHNFANQIWAGPACDRSLFSQLLGTFYLILLRGISRYGVNPPSADDFPRYYL